MFKAKLLISACLMNEPCRYDGRANLLPRLDELKEKYELIGVCPEVLGGLSIPRIACEQKQKRVINQNGEDKTLEFETGAKVVAYLVDKEQIKIALLQERSPSCGVHFIYDGSFNNKLIKGKGITSQTLLQKGIKVYSSDEVEKLLK